MAKARILTIELDLDKLGEQNKQLRNVIDATRGTYFHPGDVAIRLTKDGDKWCAIVGNMPEEDAVGFGVSQADALLTLSDVLRMRNQQLKPKEA